MRHLAFGLLLQMIAITASAQSKEIDSLLNLVKPNKKDTTQLALFIELSIVAGDDFIQSRSYGKQAVDLAIALNDEKLLLKAYVNMLKLYRAARVNDSALYFAAQSRELATKLSDANSIAEISLDVGNVYLNSHNYLTALSEFISAAHILDSLGTNSIGQMTAYANIGNIEVKLGNYEKALDYVNMGLKLAEEIHYDIGIAYSFKTLGMIYRNLNKMDLAESSFRQALERYRKMDNQRMICELFQNIGNIYFDKKDFRSAVKYYEQSLNISKVNTIEYLIPYGYSALGASWLELQSLTKAKAYFDSTLQLAYGVDPYLTEDSYENLARIAELEGNHKQSLTYFKLFTSLSDSLLAIENKTAAEEIEAKYQNAAKENEIELLTKDKELQQAKLKRQRANILIVVIVSISAIIISILLVNRYRVMNRIKRQLEMEQMRQNISRDLHDDIGSTLSSINIISQLALKDKNGQSFTHFQRIQEQSSKIMESMSDIVWSINPQNDTFQQMLAKMKEFAAEILEPKNINYRFIEGAGIASLSLDSVMRKNLFLIFKEAINNTAKYSEGTEVIIEVEATVASIKLTVRDNGKGFDANLIKNGNGLKNMETRALLLKGKLQRTSQIGKGTEINLELPIT